MEYLFWLVGAGLMGYWCYVIARRNGRDKILASVLGFLFGLLSVIVYAIVGPTQEERDRRILEVVEKNKNKK